MSEVDLTIYGINVLRDGIAKMMIEGFQSFCPKQEQEKYPKLRTGMPVLQTPLQNHFDQCFEAMRSLDISVKLSNNLVDLEKKLEGLREYNPSRIEEIDDCLSYEPAELTQSIRKDQLKKCRDCFKKNHYISC